MTNNEVHNEVDIVGIKEKIKEWAEITRVPYFSKFIFFTKHNKKNQLILDIYTEFPGCLIGRKGIMIKYYSDQLKKEFGIEKIYITQIKQDNVIYYYQM